MAEERLGASFSIDVSELKAGIAQANRLIRESESEFRAAAAGMDDWTTSEDGLNAKIRSLNSITDLQRKKVDALTSQYEQLVAEGMDPASREAVELRTKINQEMQALKKNEKELANQEAALRDLGNAADSAGDDLVDMGEQAKSSGANLEGLKTAGTVAVAAITAVAAAAAGAVTSFLGLAGSTREAREDMARLSSSFEGAQLSSESAEQTFKTLYGVIGENDTAIEAAQQIALLATSEEEAARWAEQAANVTASFGDALKPETFFEAANETLKLGEATGAFTQMLEGTGVISVDEFNAHLATLTTEQEKQAYMLELSEKAMGKAGEAYKEATGDIMDARNAEADFQMVLQELGAVAEPIMTMLTELTTDFLKELAPFIELIGEGLTDALNGTEGAADKLASGIGGLITTIVEKAAGMMPVIIETMMTLIPTLLSSLFEQLPTLYSAMAEMAEQVYKALEELLPTILPIAVEAIMMLAAEIIDNLPFLLTSSYEMIFALAEGLVEALPALIDKVPLIIEKLVKAIVVLVPKLVAMGVELIVKLAVGLVKAIPSVIKAIPKIIEALVNGIVDSIPELIEVGKDMLDGIFSGMTDAKAILSWVKDLGNSIVGGIKAFFDINSPSGLMADVVGKNLALGIGEGFVDNIGPVNDEITSAMNFEQARINGVTASRAGVGLDGAPASRSIVVNQYNTYSKAHSRLELYKTKQNTAAAVRLAMGG